ncbi:LysR substrate-binding domain-containing protein [Amphritea sp.]|uniref:LysR substrate-binding domain-containing protein n=1 Tax=Amphritea sp. TaxID=1872502 RepID=UPI003A8FBE55
MSTYFSDRITLKMLRYFYEVAQSGHFNQAAKNLKITPSPLSAQIKELESVLGVVLLERTSRSVVLTLPGEILQRECELLFRSLDRSLYQVQKASRNETHTIKIGMVSSAFWAGFGRMLKEFNRAYPDYNVELFELSPEQQKQQLLDKQIDVGLSRFADALNIYPLMSKRITDERFVIAMSDEHPLRIKKQLSLLDLKDQEFSFLVLRNSASANMVMDACMNEGFSPSIKNEFVEPTTLMAYVSSGDTITAVPSSFAQHSWDHIHFVQLKEYLPAGLCMIYDPRDMSSALKAITEKF